MTIETSTDGLEVVPAGDGEALWVGTSRITIKATTAQTGGAFGLITSEVARGSSPPLHVHSRVDEAVWVVSGRVGVRCGEDRFELGAGDYVFLPRGIPHTFLALQDTVMLGLASPGGEEEFFREAGVPATSAQPPEPDRERMTRAAEAFGDTFVGPPLTLEEWAGTGIQ